MNQDGTLNSAHPAPVGSIISLYMTGLGMPSPVPTDGSIVQLPLPLLVPQVQVHFGAPGPSTPFGQQFISVPAQVWYSRPAPFEVAGVHQVNVQVPDVVAAGACCGYTGMAPVTVKVVVPDGSAYQSDSEGVIAIQ